MAVHEYLTINDQLTSKVVIERNKIINEGHDSPYIGRGLRGNEDNSTGKATIRKAVFVLSNRPFIFSAQSAVKVTSRPNKTISS